MHQNPLRTFATSVQGTANFFESSRGVDTLRAVVVTTDKFCLNREQPTLMERTSRLAATTLPVRARRALNFGGGDWCANLARALFDEGPAFQPFSVISPCQNSRWRCGTSRITNNCRLYFDPSRQVGGAAMPLLLIGCVFLIAMSPAAAHHARVRYHANNAGRYYYASCRCDFNSPERTCVPVTSCYAEGGRCRGSCAPQSGYFPRPPY